MGISAGIRCTAVESGKSYNYPIYKNHHSISAYALPPGLPDNVRQNRRSSGTLTICLLAKRFGEIKQRVRSASRPHHTVPTSIGATSLWFLESSYRGMQNRP